MDSESIKRLKELSRSSDCVALAGVLLDDPKFAVWSGSSKPEQHHYGKGGLAQHTLEVVEMCTLQYHYLRKWYAGKLDHIHPRLMYLAALYHDSGKMWDYIPDNDKNKPEDPYEHWKSASHKYEIHHITRSVLFWNEVVYNSDAVQWWERDLVTHAILAHHGQRSWGSPVEPQNAMAWILHTCDLLSARVNDFDKRAKH